MTQQQTSIDKIVSLAKRRGFIFAGSEVYGGLANSWDFGPLGVELKNNIKKIWWKKFVQERDDVVGLDSNILMNPQVWDASGHLQSFKDPLTECKSCHKRFRADDVENAKRCPECEGELREARQFNLMFKTFLGPLEDEASQIYLRPETAQGIFVNFENVMTSQRLTLPFGIGQIGKVFRNEITPRNFIFRTLEFEQMELEYFVKPGEDDEWFSFWRKFCLDFLLELGVKKQNLKLRDHDKMELSHYSKATTDIEYNFPFGFSEVWGIANRTDWDLKRHSEFSQKDLSVRDEKTGKKFFPYVIEPSLGVERALLMILVDAYSEVEGGRTTTTESSKEVEVVLKLHKALAPVKVAVFPLSKKPNLQKMAKEIYCTLRQHWVTQYDEIASIGRRYRRQDEIGTAYCVTVDFDSLEDKKVTVRDRDTMKQERIAIEELVGYLSSELVPNL